MRTCDVIVVGGGPAGASAARRLKAGGADVVVLDKEVFPRLKLCAGWITPEVVRDVDLDPVAYPHRFLSFRRLQFHLKGLLAASAIHGLTSVLIGLLYGAMLPMYPKKPILTAGFLAPFLWTGILYSAIGIISPILDQRIDWLWFIASQIAFGLVAGYVVNLQVKVRTPQFRSLPFAVRAGIHVLGDDADQAVRDEDKAQ